MRERERGSRDTIPLRPHINTRTPRNTPAHNNNTNTPTPTTNTPRRARRGRWVAQDTPNTRSSTHHSNHNNTRIRQQPPWQARTARSSLTLHRGAAAEALVLTAQLRVLLHTHSTLNIPTRVVPPTIHTRNTDMRRRGRARPQGRTQRRRPSSRLPRCSRGRAHPLPRTTRTSPCLTSNQGGKWSSLWEVVCRVWRLM